MKTDIKIRKIQGGIDTIPENKTGYGMCAKLFNKQTIEPTIKSFDTIIKKINGKCKKLDITITHKKHSKYKWLTVIYDIDYNFIITGLPSIKSLKNNLNLL